MSPKKTKNAVKHPELVVEYVDVCDLMPAANNSRVHSEFQVAQIAASIKEFGFIVPVLINPEGTLIAGHGRVLAALQFGMEKVPAIRLGHLTVEEAEAYMIADNQLALNATWDKGMLKIEIVKLEAKKFDIGLLGFDTPKLDEILGRVPKLDLSQLAGGTSEPAAPATTAPSAAPAGDPGTSHVRMVQLFLDDLSLPKFMAVIDKINRIAGTTTTTDAVLWAVDFVDGERNDPKDK